MAAVTIPDEMVIILRTLIGDFDSSQYTDSRLRTLLAVAGHYVIIEMTFSQDFVFDVVNLTVNPDPTDPSTEDDSLVNLVSLKAACITDRGEAKVSAGQAVEIQDGTSRIKVADIARSRIELLKAGGFCPAYDDAKLQYQSGQVRIAGAAVMTPFRVFAQENGNFGFSPYQSRSPASLFP